MKVLAIAYTHYLSDPRVIRASETIAQISESFEIICLRKEEELPDEIVNDVLIRRLPLQRYRGQNILGYILHYIRFFLFITFIITTEYPRKKYDIIHVHNMPEFFVFSTIIPKLFGTKIILDMHDLMPETFETKFSKDSIAWQFLVMVEKLSTQYAHFVIGVHDVGNQILISRGVSSDKIISVMNLPDPKNFYPRKETKDTSHIQMIYHGIIANRHGLDLVILALAKLKQKGVTIQFTLIGDGDGLPEVKMLVNDLNLNDLVNIIEPYIPASEIPNYLHSAQIGIIPYRLTKSTRLMLPVKLIEYITCDLAVISSRLEVIEHYFNDDMLYFVPPGDVDALAIAIEDLYSSSELRIKLTRNANQFIKEYNWEFEKTKLISVYEKVVNM